ncbi:cell division protein FtsZ [Flavobacteriaceae bacterium]|nr:cell division protein FtsZ [Flavobacteriaceae bacterium]MDB9941487.1 cell division protein FtsZ [Flavobacteriaceae bacterium]MDC1401984.1 cell division protein FtsZ [Flavobacteriaceae bacterium]
MSEETMDTISGNFNFDLPKNRSNVIKVIGVGGGGSNAINYMFQQGIVGVDFVVCNTDAQALEKSSVPIKIQLGASLTEGLGAGANPEIGRQSAQESVDALHDLLSTQTKMVFITAGMGGGTGTGAAPIIAKMAKEMGILTVGIVTMPFQFEGKIRLEQAQRGMEEMKSNVDSLIVINNNKLREVYGNLGFKAGFAKADEVLATAAKGIAEVITHHYTQNIDLKDAKTVLSDSGSAIMGSAFAEGENRAQESIVKALDSPLLNDNKINGCKNVLLLIVSGEEEITIDEIGEINDYIQAEAGNSTNIIMGVGEDPSLGNSISVTIIATGFDSEQQYEIVNTEAKKIIHALEEEQPLVHDLTQAPASLETIFDTPIEKTIEEPVVKYSLEEEVEETVVQKVTNSQDFEAPFEEKEKEVSQEIINQIEVHAFEAVTPIAEIEVVTEVVTSEHQLIPTTVSIASLEVNAPEFVIVAKPVQNNSVPLVEEDEFVFNDISAVLNSIEVVDPELLDEEEKQQIEFEFELPLAASAKQEEMPAAVITETKIEAEAETETVFQLDDHFSVTTAVSEKEEAIDEAIEEGINFKVVEKTELPIATTQSPSAAETSPFDKSIEESISQENEKRKEQLKQFNYTFKNKLNHIEEMERQPAYKRLGFEPDEAVEEQPPSTFSLDADSNDDIQLRSNNSFLHDNVD